MRKSYCAFVRTSLKNIHRTSMGLFGCLFVPPASVARLSLAEEKQAMGHVPHLIWLPTKPRLH